MKRASHQLIISSLLFLIAFASRAEVKVVIDRNESSAATGEFKFKNVPSPSRTDAATTAHFSIVAGARDPGGGDLDVLNDGRLPREADEPAANFFFRQASDGGRLLVDLTEATEIKQVNTYSWHAGTRGPQVYKLYGADGSAADFNAKPDRNIDPEKAGWKLLAAVDTRPKQGEPGGQYGVSIADSAGAALGKYRYLLLDINSTESDDRFGNTFFSEIDVIDGKEHVAVAPEKAVITATATAADGTKYEIAIDYTDAPEFKEWIETKLRPALEKWYPTIVEMLPSEGYNAPKRFPVTFVKGMQGVAFTAGTRVQCAVPWYKGNLQGEAVGSIIHEAVHVVQQYRGRGNPGWLVEGIADYIRWFKFEPIPAGTRPRNPAQAKYTDSYRTTAGFLNYVEENVKKDTVKKLNAAMRQGKYSADLWKEYTGKTVDELWADYVKTLEKR